ncbi:MAG TPA: DUF3667 domain-containing protein [Casimicrobiaceae bacterium]|nr:DUF3667 domain-containing protein [Casimicrobiaceae bacterium]
MTELRSQMERHAHRGSPARHARSPVPRQTQLCANCGAPAPGRFCPECGQETAIGPRSAARLFEAFRAKYLSRSGLLWQTLWRLLFLPGELTSEYFAGRRARYLRPLQLYFAVSVIVFAALQLFSLDVGLRFYGQHGIQFLRSSPAPVDDDASRGARLTPVRIVLDHVDTSGVRRFKAMSAEERFKFLHARRAQYVSYLIFVLVPVFAFVLGLCYRDRGLAYGSHLVFGLHVHSFLLLMLLIEAVLPVVAANLVSLAAVAHFVVALHRVYGGRWQQVIYRGSLVVAAYFAIGFVANALLVLALLEY